MPPPPHGACTLVWYPPLECGQALQPALHRGWDVHNYVTKDNNPSCRETLSLLPSRTGYHTVSCIWKGPCAKDLRVAKKWRGTQAPAPQLTSNRVLPATTWVWKWILPQSSLR